MLYRVKNQLSANQHEVAKLQMLVMMYPQYCFGIKAVWDLWIASVPVWYWIAVLQQKRIERNLYEPVVFILSGLGTVHVQVGVVDYSPCESILFDSTGSGVAPEDGYKFLYRYRMVRLHVPIRMIGDP